MSMMPPGGVGRIARKLIHRSAWNRNSANFAFWAFCEVRIHGVLGSCATLPSQVGYSNACYVGLGSSSPLRPTGGGEREVRDVAEQTPPRYCSVCRHELKPEDVYCPKCGTPLYRAAQVPTPEADRPVPAPPQPGAGAPGAPAQEQAAQQQPTQRGWWRRHPIIITGGLGIIVVLFVYISVVGSLGGGGGGENSAKGGAEQEHNKSRSESTSGGTASTDGQIVFRRYLDLELTRSTIFTMYPNGSHIRQITNPPKGWGD